MRTINYVFRKPAELRPHSEKPLLLFVAMSMKNGDSFTNIHINGERNPLPFKDIYTEKHEAEHLISWLKHNGWIEEGHYWTR